MVWAAQCTASPHSVQKEGKALIDQSLLDTSGHCHVQTSSVTWKGESFPINNPPRSCRAWPNYVYFLPLKDFELTLEEQCSNGLPATLSPGSALLGALQLPFIAVLKGSKVLGERQEPGSPCVVTVFGKGKERSILSLFSWKVSQNV